MLHVPELEEGSWRGVVAKTGGTKAASEIPRGRPRLENITKAYYYSTVLQYYAYNAVENEAGKQGWSGIPADRELHFGRNCWNYSGMQY